MIWIVNDFQTFFFCCITLKGYTFFFLTTTLLLLYKFLCIVFIINTKWSEVAQWCPTLCDPVIYSPPGSSLHGILQARILEWVAISFSRGSSRPRDQARVSRIAGRRFNLWATIPQVGINTKLSLIMYFNFFNLFLIEG